MVGEHLVRFQLLAAMNTLVLIYCDYRAASLVGCVFIAEIAGGGRDVCLLSFGRHRKCYFLFNILLMVFQG